MLLHHAVLADVDPVLEAEEVGHLALRAFAQTHLEIPLFALISPFLRFFVFFLSFPIFSMSLT